jgi:hypothetical protein
LEGAQGEVYLLKGAGTLKTKERNRQEGAENKKFRIDWLGYNADDPKKREERTDVSPAGTEGIFIDPEAYKYD